MIIGVLIAVFPIGLFGFLPSFVPNDSVLIATMCACRAVGGLGTALSEVSNGRL